MVAEVEEALELRGRGTGDLCIGEVDGMRPGGFDLGNSPFEMSQADVEGKTLIQSTRAGTMGVSAAGGAGVPLKDPSRNGPPRWGPAVGSCSAGNSVRRRKSMENVR